MSLHSIREANRLGKITIVERGSAHIQYQNSILKEEYNKFGVKFEIDPKVVKKEIAEYQETQFISIPSTFVHDSFTEHGVSSQKLLLNPYGTSSYFETKPDKEQHQLFTVLYVGVLSIRKGLIYLFQALEELNDQFAINAVFIGNIDQELKQLVDQYQLKFKNWKFLGHVNHYQLTELITECHVAVVPSIEDGFGMIVSQILSCGVPVIVSANTGGKDVVEEGKTGFIVPIRSAKAIANQIKHLIENPELLNQMKINITSKQRNYSWDRYGVQYADTIKYLLEEKSANLHGK
jgi:glycosyltransferase involved in cell wall biosynthesis